MRSFRPTVLLAAAVAALFVAGTASSALGASTTVQVSGIGTSIPGPPFTIATHVSSITYTGPTLVQFSGNKKAFEIRGTISGVGWGGGGAVARARNAHYNYEMAFVARWPSNGKVKDAAFFAHGGGAFLASLIREKAAGAADGNRYAELAGDDLVGVGALLNRMAYVSIGRKALKNDGTFNATYLTSEVPPLTQAEVTAIYNQLPPGNPGFVQPGLVAGAPVPLTTTTDAPTLRDVTRALFGLVEDLADTSFRTKIAAGNSAGTLVLSALDFGRQTIDTQNVFTGGNRTGGPGTPRIFDGFILTGFPIAVPLAGTDPAEPISAPTFFPTGRADERYQGPIHMAQVLLDQGVDIAHWVWIYDWKNVPHVTRDVTLDVLPPSNGGDRFGCVISAALRNLRDYVREGELPPVSRIAGRILNGALVFDQAGGTTTNVAPLEEDADIDVLLPNTPMIVPQTIGPAHTARWLAVTATLPHLNEAIAGPVTVCRTGGFKINFFGLEPIPFPAEVLTAMYGGFGGYRECVEAVVEDLEEADLYDPRVESARESADHSWPLD